MMRIWLSLFIALIAAPVAAETCRDITHEDRSYSVCEVPQGADLRLWLRSDVGEVLGNFTRLRNHVEAGDTTLVFAMNAGMYHADRSPVGLYIEDGRELAPIVTREGPGNFGMLPNGVMCLGADGVSVQESRAFKDSARVCDHASQSGPMLVIDGALHPRFLPDATSRNIRNGVGVTADGTAYFAISNQRVTFHEFARLFRDVLNTPNALYFDGKISRLYAPELNREDGGFPMGPMVGLIKTGD